MIREVESYYFLPVGIHSQSPFFPRTYESLTTHTVLKKSQVFPQLLFSRDYRLSTEYR